MSTGPDGAELQHTTLLQCLGGVTAGTRSAGPSFIKQKRKLRHFLALNY